MFLYDCKWSFLFLSRVLKVTLQPGHQDEISAVNVSMLQTTNTVRIVLVIGQHTILTCPQTYTDIAFARHDLRIGGAGGVGVGDAGKRAAESVTFVSVQQPDILKETSGQMPGAFYNDQNRDF